MKSNSQISQNLRALNRTALFWILVLTIWIPRCSAQSNPPSQDQATKPSDEKPWVKSHDSVTVSANLTPEEAEEGRINDVYQSIYPLEQKNDCENAIQRYKLEVIPLAEQSKFEMPKNKFLFLANRGIGNCYLAQRRYEEAEKSFQLIMEYLPVWPGADDSDYPINFRQIATAQIGQQHWEAAEESLKKSVALFDPQIARALDSKVEFSRTEYAGNLLGSQARSRAYLAIVYLRERQTAEALKNADLAYDEATKPNVRPSFLNEIVKIGSTIAQVSGDGVAIAKWSQRASSQN